MSTERMYLSTAQSSKRLEQIASLRTKGVGEHIDLPQLIVCGDQSAGKSSVLEGLTGLPFPRQDGVCTKFATEIILQHRLGEEIITASILPCPSRSDELKAALRRYTRQLQDFTELPDVIKDVGRRLGIRGFAGLENGPAFVEDVLRIEVIGPVGMHLSVVDLPGLISVESDEQTESDIQTVLDLVRSYMENPRTIILAVIQAGNDIANQRVIKLAKSFDGKGQRTVGIITKPDLINKGTEKRIALLAKNQDTTRLKLGFFIVKNPDPNELANGITAAQRSESEMRFFQAAHWKEQQLDSGRVGIIALQKFLQKLLDTHIEQELPKVREDIQKLLTQTKHKLDSLGDARTTAPQVRQYLSRIAMKFHDITTSALTGTYHEAESSFFSDDCDTRLRASIHRLNTQFSDDMRERGEKRKVGKFRVEDDFDEYQSSEEEELSETEHGRFDDILSVTPKEMRNWVKEIYKRTRGKELPGNYNHVLLSELFHEQSSRWPSIAGRHLDTIFEKIATFVRTVMRHTVPDEQVLSRLIVLTEKSLQERKASAVTELNALCIDELQQPITYNHYYTDNVQRARQDGVRKMLQQMMDETRSQDWNGKFHVSNNSIDADRLLASLQKRVVVNMDEQACVEALDGLKAYYKVAMKTFVDNVCKQVIERHLLRELPQLFCSELVAMYTDEELWALGAESNNYSDLRRSALDLYHNLKDGLEDLSK